MANKQHLFAIHCEGQWCGRKNIGKSQVGKSICLLYGMDSTGGITDIYDMKTSEKVGSRLPCLNKEG